MCEEAWEPLDTIVERLLDGLADVLKNGEPHPIQLDTGRTTATQATRAAVIEFRKGPGIRAGELVWATDRPAEGRRVSVGLPSSERLPASARQERQGEKLVIQLP